VFRPLARHRVEDDDGRVVERLPEPLDLSEYVLNRSARVPKENIRLFAPVRFDTLFEGHFVIEDGDLVSRLAQPCQSKAASYSYTG
jgi:hypothetical protein